MRVLIVAHALISILKSFAKFSRKRVIGDENMPTEIDTDVELETWLPCVPWTGEERDLPRGGYSKIPGFDPVKLVNRWEVLDAEAEEGSRMVKAAELKPGDLIIGAKMNEKSIKRLVATYGPRFVVLEEADPGLESAGYRKLTCEQWHTKYGTDGLALWAIRNKRFGRI